MKKTIRILGIPIVLSILTAFAVFLFPINGEREIYDKVIRLHVIADSDDTEAQRLKLAVRDKILEKVTAYTDGCGTREEAEQAISLHTSEIQSDAETVLRENGCSLPVSVILGTEDYPTREYGELRLPAGEYTSLRVMIGEAEGKNWWCVLFPPLCVKTASPKDELISAGFTPEEVKILTDSDDPKYVLKFRIIEIIEALFS